jgi:hypothetical protein
LRPTQTGAIHEIASFREVLRLIGVLLSVAQATRRIATNHEALISHRIIPSGTERSIFERATTAQLRLNRDNIESRAPTSG